MTATTKIRSLVARKLDVPMKKPFGIAGGAQALAALGQEPGGPAAARPAAEAWAALSAELDSTVTLGGRKVARRQILAAWLDAAAF